MTGRECIRCGLLIPPKMEWDGATTQRDACPAYDIARCRERVEARATVVRALTAQAWQTAVSFEWALVRFAETSLTWSTLCHGVLAMREGIAALPAPADLAADILGGA